MNNGKKFVELLSIDMAIEKRVLIYCWSCSGKGHIIVKNRLGHKHERICRFCNGTGSRMVSEDFHRYVDHEVLMKKQDGEF